MDEAKRNAAEAAEAILEYILRVVIERGIEAMIRKARAAGTCWLCGVKPRSLPRHRRRHHGGPLKPLRLL